MKKVIVSLCILLTPYISNGMLDTKARKVFFKECEDGNEKAVRTTLETLKPETKEKWLHHQNYYMRTPLLLAAENCHIGIMKLLCEHKADPNQLSKVTPAEKSAGVGELNPLDLLVLMIKPGEEQARSEGARILIEHKADVNYMENDNRYDDSILATAVSYGNYIQFVQTLIDLKADPNLGHTRKLPLYYAVSNEECSKDMITTLLNAGAIVNKVMIEKAKNPEIKTLLEQAYTKQQ